MKIVGVSDIHERWHNLVIPECDVLISAGDYSNYGAPDVVKRYHEWLNRQPAKHIVSGQGNHEVWVEDHFGEAMAIAKEACPRVNFLSEGAFEIDGVKFYYSAITPMFFNWAWNRTRGEQIKIHWDLIPPESDIIITHGPPKGILDLTYRYGVPHEHAGCEELLLRIKEIKPDLHMFGHIHPGHGEHHEDGTSFYNMAICDERHAPVNAVTVIEYNLE